LPEPLVVLLLLGVFFLRATNSTSIFLVKYSSSGTVIWAKQSINRSYLYNTEEGAIAIDQDNNTFVTGNFQDTISFGANTLTTSGLCNFLVKYDPSGNVLWAKQASMPSNSCNSYANSVALDNKGNAYITGYFETAVFFGAYHLISLNNYSVFLAKYSAGGNLLWAKQSINLNSIFGYGYSTSVAIDSRNNPYITGSFDDSIKFGSHILYSLNNYYDAYLTKYDTNGNVIWAEQSSLGLTGASLASDKSNHIYLGGTTNLNDTTYTFGGYALHSTPWATGNAFLLKFDTNGTAICGSIIENAGLYGDIGITSDSSENYIYMAGTFANDTLHFGPDTLVPSNGGDGVFLARWQNCAKDAGINSITAQNAGVILYPNPNNGQFTIKPSVISGQSSVQIYNMLGEKIYSNAFTTYNSQFTIDLSSQPNGIYLYRVISETGSLVGDGKLIIQK
jgi:hypothetical protein